MATSTVAPQLCSSNVTCELAQIGDTTVRVAFTGAPSADSWTYVHFGGPGISNVDEMLRSSDFLRKLYPATTFVTFDQEGTGDRYPTDDGCEATVRDALLNSQVDAASNEVRSSVGQACSTTASFGATRLSSELLGILEQLRRTGIVVPPTINLLGVSYGAFAVSIMATDSRLAEVLGKVVLDAPATYRRGADEDAADQEVQIAKAIDDLATTCAKASVCPVLGGFEDAGSEFVQEGEMKTRALASRIASLSLDNSIQFVSIVESSDDSQSDVDQRLATFVRSSWDHLAAAAWIRATCAAMPPPGDEQTQAGDMQEVYMAELNLCADISQPHDPQFVLPQKVPTLVLLNDRDPVIPADQFTAAELRQQNLTVVRLSHYGHSSVMIDPCGIRRIAEFLDRGRIQDSTCPEYDVTSVLSDLPD